METLKNLILLILTTPAPRFVVNGVMALVYGARISPWAVIRYFLNVRLAPACPVKERP